MTDELKPLNCPICKLEVQHRLRGNDYTESRQYEIKCKNCNLVMIVGAIRNNCDWVKKKCIEQWNNRAPDPRLEKALAFIKRISDPVSYYQCDCYCNTVKEICMKARELLKELE